MQGTVNVKIETQFHQSLPVKITGLTLSRRFYNCYNLQHFNFQSSRKCATNKNVLADRRTITVVEMRMVRTLV
jgi:hypothetical protein